MSADISPHTYHPIPTTPQHCRVCLGTVRNDFCREPAGMRAPSPADLARGYSLGSPFDLAGRVRPEMRSGKPDELVGITEIAQRVGTTPGTVQSWRRRHADFPQPAVQLASGPVWRWVDLAAWFTRPRPPGRRRRDK